MDLIKDEGIDEMKQMFYSGFQSKDGNDSIYFDNGKIEATAYSYEIGSTGSVELNGEQTLELYLAMKKFYDSVG
tara:strand:- start:343 stop:564 length:222 start_codon:yes stop_codon:yes gene_type:complete